MNIPQHINAKTDQTWKNFWEKVRKYIPLAIFIIAAYLLVKYFDTALLKEFLDQHEKLGMIACLCAYVLLGVTVIPSDPITFLVFTWKGPVVAILLAVVGNTLSSIVEFYVGRSIGDLANFEKQKENLPFHLGRLPVNSPVFLIFARLLTSYGSKFVSIAAGVYRVPLSTFLWTALVANLMGGVVTVVGGYGLIKLFQ
jgi:uncharacterized membrane protein YdjX (TVP38/TMEM64 family)